MIAQSSKVRMMDGINPRAVPGHNNPPPSPLEWAETEIGNLHSEIAVWLDHGPIPNQEVANDISNLLNDVREAVKRADAARKTEKEPYDKAAKAVDAAYKPIIVRGNSAVEFCKSALTVWLQKVDAEKRREAEAKRLEAERLKSEAEAAIRSSSGNLIARDAAEQLLNEAKKADRAANKAEKNTATAGTGEIGRAVSLRTVHVAELVDPNAALAHYKRTAPDDLKQFLTNLAERDIRAGKRDIPGFVVSQEKKAV